MGLKKGFQKEKSLKERLERTDSSSMTHRNRELVPVTETW